PPPGHASVWLRIVTFSIPPNARGEHPLAWVAVGRDGLPAPILFVSLPAIAAVLADTDVGGYPFKRLPTERSAQLIAQAVGRAAAHELGHYLLQRARHQHEGLMRPSYSPRDLIGAWRGPFQLDPEERPTALAEIEALAHGSTALEGRCGCPPSTTLRRDRDAGGSQTHSRRPVARQWQ